MIAPLPDLPAPMEEAIQRAVRFVCRERLTPGLFSTLASSATDLGQARDVESPYLTTYIIHALTQVAPSAAEPAIAAAARGLWQHREPGGMWRFFGRSAENPPLDFDDSCCALVALHQAGLPTDNKLLHFLGKAQFASGGYGTWLLPRLNSEAELDVVVNANILLYLASTGQPTAALARFLVEMVIQRGFRRLSSFALSEAPSFYALARAYRHGPAPELAPLLPALADAVRKHQRADGSFGDELETALSLTALLDVGQLGSRLDATADWLRVRQRSDGSWPARVFFCDFAPTYYGSAELTTALCAEALHKQMVQ